jgi:translation initiation factor 1
LAVITAPLDHSITTCMSQSKAAPRDGGGIVYSTGIGERCPNCLRPVAQCVCKKGTPGKTAAAKTSTDRVVRVSRETQGRKGKGVTVITGLGLPPSDLEALATELKKKCGSGGAVEAGKIEIQGDHRDRLVEELTKRGWNAKRAGG